MSRPNIIPDDIETAGKLYLNRLEWIDGDYDKGGAYWGGGMGNNMYRAMGETETEVVEVFVRAVTRKDAKARVKELIETAKFYK